MSGSASPAAAAPASNVVSVVVDGGPTNNSVNTLYTTVTVCVPGSSTSCQTIDHIQVDTMSYGLRLLAPVVTLDLPVTKTSAGTSLVECTVFVDGYSFGPVASVDVMVSGESAKSVPVQLIGDARFPNVPADCSSAGPAAEDTVAQFGANGLLGIGPFVEDCGSACATSAVPATYYACATASACQATTVPVASQVQNPVPLFGHDNNGTIIELPSVSASGAASVSGTLIFGIDTESNNQLGTKTVLTLDPTTGNLTSILNNQPFTSSFIDSGSNAVFFDDSSLTVCSAAGFASFYCSSAQFNATLQGKNGVMAGVVLVVGNAQTALTSEPSFTAFPDLAGTSSSSGSIDWGLPFFYGRGVATAIEGYATSSGPGPFVAF
jgi:hypothetical protein